MPVSIFEQGDVSSIEMQDEEDAGFDSHSQNSSEMNKINGNLDSNRR